MKDKVKIRIRYHADIERIKKISIGDWIDLRAAEDIALKQWSIAYISLGVSMELPKGYEAIIAPRSSTPGEFGIICVNSIGIIDNSYCGDNDIWKFPALAIRDTRIKKGDRICQFRILNNQPEIEIVEVRKLGHKSRGGIGSTGRK